MTRLRILILVPLLFFTACTHHAPIATVELIDTSLSISPPAEQAALGAIKGQISLLDRGDTLVLIPITGNATNDAGGRILRLQAPTKREPYDAGLRRFRDDAEKRVAAWSSSERAEPGHTDILGALDAAAQELASFPKGSARRLIVVSDFLEDDGQYNFVSDPSLANPPRARGLAAHLLATRGFTLHGISLCLGHLASRQFGSLSPERRAAIDAFWKTYLVDDGHAPEIEIDGVGILEGADGVCFKEIGGKEETKRNTP